LVFPKVCLAVRRDSGIPSKELRPGDEVLIRKAGTAIAITNCVPFNTIFKWVLATSFGIDTM
jgi:hypothetical protein